MSGRRAGWTTDEKEIEIMRTREINVRLRIDDRPANEVLFERTWREGTGGESPFTVGGRMVGKEGWRVLSRMPMRGEDSVLIERKTSTYRYVRLR